MKIKSLFATLPIIVVLTACTTGGNNVVAPEDVPEPVVLVETNNDTQEVEPASDSDVLEDDNDDSQTEASGCIQVTDGDTEYYFSADDMSLLGKIGTYCTEGGLGNKTIMITGKLEWLLPSDDGNGGTLVFWDSDDTFFCPAPQAAKNIYDKYGTMQNCVCTIKITFSEEPIKYTIISPEKGEEECLSYITDVEMVSYKQLDYFSK